MKNLLKFLLPQLAVLNATGRDQTAKLPELLTGTWGETELVNGTAKGARYLAGQLDQNTTQLHRANQPGHLEDPYSVI